MLYTNIAGTVKLEVSKVEFKEIVSNIISDTRSQATVGLQNKQGLHIGPSVVYLVKALEKTERKV
jgi:hypothetical protein